MANQNLAKRSNIIKNPTSRLFILLLMTSRNREYRDRTLPCKFAEIPNFLGKMSMARRYASSFHKIARLRDARRKGLRATGVRCFCNALSSSRDRANDPPYPTGAFAIPSSRYLLDFSVGSLTAKSRRSHDHGNTVSPYLLCLKTAPLHLRP